jgi:hypothetical protein
VEGAWGESRQGLGLFLFDACGLLSCLGTGHGLGYFDGE